MNVLVSDVKKCFRTMASLASLFVILNLSNVIDGVKYDI